ncbi:hypothetical protein STENM223S_04983 [Streptomyces tendae]
MRRGFVGVQGPGQDAVPHRLHHLDDAPDTGGGLGVADVGLQRAEQERVAGGAAGAVDGLEGLCLDGVAEGGAGAVGLDGVDLVGGHAGGGQGVGDDAFLGPPAGGGQAVALDAVVDGAAPDDGEHPVAEAAGVLEPFQEQQTGPLGPAGAVGGRGERLAAAVGGESALPAELHERHGCGHDGGPAGQGERALAPAQCGTGQVQGHQRGGAGGVHGHRGTAQAEGVGDASGGDAAGAAESEIALVLGRGGCEARAVVAVHGADEDAGAAAAQSRRVESGVLQGLPGGLQQQPVLRVHGVGLTRADAEELRVEPCGVGEESSLLHVRGAGGVGVRVVEGGQVPAAVVGEGPDGVDLVGDQPPQVLGAGDAAGVAAGHADDGDRAGRLLGVAGGRPEALVLLQRRPQRVDDLLVGCGRHRVSP